MKHDEAERFRRMALSAVLEGERKKKYVKKVTVDKETVKELKALGYIQ